MLAQVKESYKLEQAMEIEHWSSQVDSSFTTGIDLLTVSQFNYVLWFWHVSTGYLARIFRAGALHWYISRAAQNVITRSMYPRPCISPESFDCQHIHVLKRCMVLIKIRSRMVQYCCKCVLKPRAECSAQAMLKLGREKKRKRKKKLTRDGTAESVSRDQIIR